jgi:hypothetical protein
MFWPEARRCLRREIVTPPQPPLNQRSSAAQASACVPTTKCLQGTASQAAEKIAPLPSVIPRHAFRRGISLSFQQVKTAESFLGERHASE